MVFHQLWPPTCVSMASASHPHSPKTSVPRHRWLRISTEIATKMDHLNPWGEVRPRFLWPKNKCFSLGFCWKKTAYGGLKTKTNLLLMEEIWLTTWDVWNPVNIIHHINCCKIFSINSITSFCAQLLKLGGEQLRHPWTIKKSRQRLQKTWGVIPKSDFWCPSYWAGSSHDAIATEFHLPCLSQLYWSFHCLHPQAPDNNVSHCRAVRLALKNQTQLEAALDAKGQLDHPSAFEHFGCWERSYQHHQIR